MPRISFLHSTGLIALLGLLILLKEPSARAGEHGPGERASSTPDELPLEGVVRPFRELRLGAAQDGLIESVRFDVGDVVPAGEVVATLDTRVARAQTELARYRAGRGSAARMVEAKLRDARRRLEAQEALHGDGIAPAETVDMVRTEVRLEELASLEQEEESAIAALELERSLATLAQARITCPARAVVIERALSPGEYYSRAAGLGVVTLAVLDPLVIEVNVPIEELDALAVGDRARVRLDLAGRPEHLATVQTVGRVVDTASRTFRVRLHLANPDLELPAGLRCRVSFDD